MIIIQGVEHPAQPFTQPALLLGLFCHNWPQNHCQSSPTIIKIIVKHHHHDDIQGVEHPAQPATQPTLQPGLLGEVAAAQARQEQAPLRLQHQVARLLSEVWFNIDRLDQTRLDRTDKT